MTTKQFRKKLIQETKKIIASYPDAKTQPKFIMFFNVHCSVK